MAENTPPFDPANTRAALLDAAHRLFAQHGYHAASIAQIAGEVGLTKQALLYHFKRKDDLYAEVLKGIAGRLLDAMRQATQSDGSPAQRFEQVVMNMYREAFENPLDTKVLMRELLDDQRREAPPSQWFFRTFLDEMVALLDEVPGQRALPKAQKLARIYGVMSVIQYFTASHAALTRFYGEEGFAEITQEYPQELRAIVRRMLVVEDGQ